MCLNKCPIIQAQSHFVTLVIVFESWSNFMQFFFHFDIIKTIKNLFFLRVHNWKLLRISENCSLLNFVNITNNFF